VEKKENKNRVVKQPHYGRSITNLYPANAREVGPQLRDSQRVWFGGGGNWAYFQFPTKVSFGICFAGMTSLPKIGSKWLGSLDAC